MAFSTNGTCGGNGLSSEINVTPLIDVLLVLLIIFMVIAPVTPRGLATIAPSSGVTSGGDEAVRPVLIQVESGEAEARYRVDGQRLDKSELGPRLVELLGQKSTRSVLLKGDSVLDFGVISGVIDAGQAAGAESVGLVTPGVERPRNRLLR
jgi:biopolymer transport protein TolR